MKEMSKHLNISRRGIRRVLHEENINTRLKNRYHINNENYFHYIDTEFKAYILGFIYADGFVGKHDDFCISLSDKVDDNLKILKMFKEELDTNLEIRHSYNNCGSGNYTFKFSNKTIVNDLNLCGVHTCKSLNMTEIPKNIDPIFMNHFIRGYFDGDGTICTYYDTYDKRQRYTMEILGTQEFLDKIHNIICTECQIKPTALHDVKRVPGLTRISHRGIENLIKIRDYLYNNATIYLTYKFERFNKIQPL